MVIQVGISKAFWRADWEYTFFNLTTGVVVLCYPELCMN